MGAHFNGKIQENIIGRQIKKILSDEIKLLTFQQFKLDVSIYKGYLLFGIVFTWLCGIGRYWDNERAELWQYLGLGSIGYIFVMAFVIWVIVLPLKPSNWSYKNVLLFVSLTSPPAILYAIPVERFMSLESAQVANVWFLVIVATWRVALLFAYIKNVGQLSGACVLVASLLPLTLIVAGLTALNLEHVVFRIMAGLEEHEKSANDAAYTILLLITWFSVMASPVLLGAYSYLVYRRRKYA